MVFFGTMIVSRFSFDAISRRLWRPISRHKCCNSFQSLMATSYRSNSVRQPLSGIFMAPSQKQPIRITNPRPCQSPRIGISAYISSRLLHHAHGSHSSGGLTVASHMQNFPHWQFSDATGSSFSVTGSSRFLATGCQICSGPHSATDPSRPTPKI
jgi:hypothetical protein